jgi:xylulokinase
MSVAAQCHGLVALDAAGDVIRPAKLWNDTTSAPQATRMVERFGSAWWAREIGLVPSAALTIAKLAWLRENEPDAFARLDRVAVPHDWLTLRLTGNHVTDRSDASGTGFFSAQTNRWRTDILDEVVAPRDWLRMLPSVLGPDDAAGTLTADAAAALGLDPGIPVSAGGGDQHLAAQGIGLEKGDIAYSLGTSGVVLATTGQPVHDEGGAIDGVANATGGFLPLVCTLNCTKVTDQVARLLGVTPGELDALAVSAPLSAGRPVMAAFLDGERSPRMPWAHGMLSGLTSATSREDVALAAFEGVALGLVRGQRRLEQYGIPVTGRTIAVGGGARAVAYRQAIADLTARPVITVDAPEGTARGAAVQAAAVVESRSVADVTRQWRPAQTSVVEPRNDRSDIWTRYLELADLQADGRTF